LNKATTSRLLSTLAHRSFVHQDERTRKYVPGGRLLAIAHKRLFGLAFRDQVQRLMYKLSQVTGETIGLYVAVGSDRVCVDVHEGTRELRHIIQIGNRRPLTLGSTGRAFLAFMPENEVEHVLEQRPLTQVTPFTNTNLVAFRAELPEVRRVGFAYCKDETIVGIAGISVPVLALHGYPIAVICCSGPSTQLTEARAHQFAQAMLAATQDLSASLKRASAVRVSSVSHIGQVQRSRAARNRNRRVR
jgi:DNA-binding IclR family transcriptional regulator